MGVTWPLWHIPIQTRKPFLKARGRSVLAFEPSKCFDIAPYRQALLQRSEVTPVTRRKISHRAGTHTRTGGNWRTMLVKFIKRILHVQDLRLYLIRRHTSLAQLRRSISITWELANNERRWSYDNIALQESLWPLSSKSNTFEISRFQITRLIDESFMLSTQCSVLSASNWIIGN